MLSNIKSSFTDYLDTCLRDGGQEDSSNKEIGAVGSTAAVSWELGRGCLVSLWYIQRKCSCGLLPSSCEIKVLAG